MAPNTVRTNPEVPKRLLNDLKVAIQVFNDGKLKGRLSPTISEAIQLYLVSMYAREPSRLKHLEQYIDVEEVEELDDPDEYRERILLRANGVSGAVQEVAHQLHREHPGEPTLFEQFLKLQNSSGATYEQGGTDVDQSILETSLVQHTHPSPEDENEVNTPRGGDD